MPSARLILRTVSDPLAGSPWSAPATVAGFAQSAPNEVLLRFARQELERLGGDGTALDIGCGAGRNAVPLVEMGWTVVGIDLSWPMLEAAAKRTIRGTSAGDLALCLAPMEALPVADGSADLVIAHGTWNLARSDRQFRQAVHAASRAAKPGAGLFVFTFSRHTLPTSAHPVPGEAYVFTQFSGQEQCFLTEAQLLDELAAENFAPDSGVPLTEYNRRSTTTFQSGPVIYEAAFRKTIA
jgi:SAM-dependent methyltransferase